MVIKTKKGWQIRNEKTGMIMPHVYASKEEAQKRINEMKMFKHLKK